MEGIRFGICAEPDQLAAAASAGYDYIELDLNRVLSLDEAAYREMTGQMERFGVYAEVVHNPLPEGMHIVGDGVSAQALHAHLEQSFQLARMLGAEIIVFDCAASRMLPRGFDPAMAWRQLGNFIRILQSHAADNDLKVALLPLRRSAAELMNYVTEATLISAMLRLDRVGVAASSYNMAMEAESLPQLGRTGSLLWHMRTSNVLGNRAPKSGDGEDYAALFAALKEMGYTGRVTMEGSCADFAADAAAALVCLKNEARRGWR
ncbi:MAG: sugar phosphate isomerase/epimerase [Clostridia bacterium]|nr:sugar phosphate isomerase/epimerase [Clostridia bacterium]